MASPTSPPNRLFLILAALAATFCAYGLTVGPESAIGYGVVGCFVALAFYFRRHPTLNILTFTLWLTISTVSALFWPEIFLDWNGFKLNSINLYLVQLIMFCMGATLSVDDFLGALKMPKAVLIGMLLQFTVMPLVGLAVGLALGFAPEVAAGVILVGSCSGGVASNLMVFLARGNVALSVTMTACATLIAPIMTPMLMQTLAGRLIEIDFWAMSLSIINLVIIPIGAGLIINRVVQRRRTAGDFAKATVPLAILFGAGVATTAGLILFLGGATPDFPFVMARVHQGLILSGLTAAIGLLLNATLAGHREEFQKYPPVISMFAICAFLAIVTANSRDDLISIGVLIVVAAFIHNVVGYLLGYGLAGLVGIKGQNRRTVAFEVGMQNTGMAGGLALDVLKSTGAILAPIIFGTVMNVTGSMLASYWRDRPPVEDSTA
jgi:BASS family bile acid:Na+ symporter